jgi:hypothetical protein
MLSHFTCEFLVTLTLFFIGTLIFDLVTFTLEFDNDGHLWDLPCMGALVFHIVRYRYGLLCLRQRKVLIEVNDGRFCS